MTCIDNNRKIVFSFPFEECESGKIMFAKKIEVDSYNARLIITFYPAEKEGYKSLFLSWSRPIYDMNNWNPQKPGETLLYKRLSPASMIGYRKADISRDIHFASIPIVYSQFKRTTGKHKKIFTEDYMCMIPLRFDEENCTITFGYDFLKQNFS